MTLIDTSSWIDYLRQKSSAAGNTVEALFLNDEAAWCDMTLVELWNGVRGEKEQRELVALEEEINLVPVDFAVWRFATALAYRCRSRGITAPTSDIVIAACSCVHGLELEHCDRHFDDILPLAKVLRGQP